MRRRAIQFKLSQHDVDRINKVLSEVDYVLEKEGVEIENFYRGQGWIDLVNQLEINKSSQFAEVEDEIQKLLDRYRYVENLLRYPGGSYYRMPLALRAHWRALRMSEHKLLSRKIRMKQPQLERRRNDLFEVRAVLMAQMLGVRRLSSPSNDWDPLR